MTALLEYLDLTALLEYIDLLNRYSGDPSWGLLGPLSGWGPGQNAPVAPPLWAALTDILAYQMKIATRVVSGNPTNQQLQFTLPYHIAGYIRCSLFHVLIAFISSTPSKFSPWRICFSHLVCCEMAKEIFT